MAGLEPWRDLDDLDLSSLDLDHIQLDDDGPRPPWASLGVVLVLAATGGLLLWIPHTEIYQVYGGDNTFFFVLAAADIAVGLGFGRAFWVFLRTWALWYAEREGTPHRPKRSGPRIPLAVQRWLLLLGGLGGLAALLADVPSRVASGTDALFLSAAGAVLVGVFLGRWLMLQASTGGAPLRLPRPRLPPWFKWVNLGLLLAGALLALVGTSLFAGRWGATDVDFVFSALAFTVGIFGAIWIARRFDELERRFREQRTQRSTRGPKGP